MWAWFAFAIYARRSLVLKQLDCAPFGNAVQSITPLSLLLQMWSLFLPT